MNKNKVLLVSALILILGACETITIQPDGGSKITSTPTFQETRPFYFWGLAGEERVDVKKVCNDKTVIQMQSQTTLENGFLRFLTLGIYSPHSVKVWCEG